MSDPVGPAIVRVSTVLDVVRLASTYLAEHGSASARLDAELLTAHALGLRRLDLYLQYDRPLGEVELAPVRALLRRRGQGEPVAYILGTREFYGRTFLVTPAVLIPRPETETLVESVLTWAHRGQESRPLRIADIGTGSGCVACTLAAELPSAGVVASDSDPAAIAVAAENARRLGVHARVETVVGEWAQPLAGREPFDVVVSNPPYVLVTEMPSLMRDVRDHEPRLALDGGEDGLHAYRQITGEAAAVLRVPGLFAVEIDPRRAHRVREMVEQCWPGAEVAVTADLGGAPRVVEARLRG